MMPYIHLFGSTIGTNLVFQSLYISSKKESQNIGDVTVSMLHLVKLLIIFVCFVLGLTSLSLHIISGHIRTEPAGNRVLSH